MEPHDARDIDDVIDDVARAMTSARLERDLRPTLAVRAAATPPSASGWRLGMAAASLVALVVAVAVMSRPGGEPQQTRRAAGPDARPVVTAPDEPRIVRGPATATPQAVRHERRVGRQTVLHTTGTEDIVVIRPLAVVPLEGDDVITTAPVARQVVTIAPIDVEPVRISALGEQVE
jgi:hypothetical protein